MKPNIYSSLSQEYLSFKAKGRWATAQQQSETATEKLTHWN